MKSSMTTKNVLLMTNMVMPRLSKVVTAVAEVTVVVLVKISATFSVIFLAAAVAVANVNNVVQIYVTTLNYHLKMRLKAKA
ncbi:hypothetical protein BPTFM16_02859 [Altererythrobacter insulae]|nr:hypothetical protein BPTFM16_02859 [Altererythrobacter insulae]